VVAPTTTAAQPASNSQRAAEWPCLKMSAPLPSMGSGVFVVRRPAFRGEGCGMVQPGATAQDHQRRLGNLIARASKADRLSLAFVR
jgi:hypothetical protein